MIDLSHKPPRVESSPAAPDEPSYPGFSFDCDKEMKMPSGAFTADVKMRMKRHVAEEQPGGKKRHTYHMELMGMDHKFKAEKQEPAEEADDATGALGSALRDLRHKKIAEQDNED